MKKFKKLLSVILASAIMCSVLSALNFNAFADSSNGFNYTVNSDGTATITGSTLGFGPLNIPSSIDGHKVTAIGYKAFYQTARYSKITIPSTVTSIGEYAFYWSDSITSVEINTTGTLHIGDYAFYCDYNMRSLKWPTKGSVYLGSWSFLSLNIGDEVVLPKCIVSIKGGSFHNGGFSRVIIENPNCYIEDVYYRDTGSVSGYVRPFNQNIKICADEVSTAHTYATRFNHSFEVHDSHNNNTTYATKVATATQNGRAVTTCDYCGMVLSDETVYSIKSVSLSTTSYTYDGKEKKPSVKAVDSNNKTIPSKYYTVSYPSGRKNAGEYKVKITFKDLYSGSYTKSFKINKKALKKADIKVANTTYTGKATYPTVKYKDKTLKKNTDYTISKISKNKAIGTASVTLKFKGNYSGSVSTTYKINPKKVTGFKFKSRDTTSVTFKWNKVAGADGYKVYRYNHNNCKYEYYGTTKSTSMKITKSKKGKSKDYGYVIAKVRAYKKVGNTTYYGAYSAENSNCIKPPKPSYKVTCPTFGRMRVIFNSLEYSTTYVQIQICINKSFNSDEYYVVNDYDSIIKASDNHSIEYYGFTSNKYYYVRCRQYLYNKDMNPIYSAWGEAKKVYIQ